MSRVGSLVKYLVDPYGLLPRPQGDQKSLDRLTGLLNHYNRSTRSHLHGHLIVAVAPVVSNPNAAKDLLYGAFPYGIDSFNRSALMLLHLPPKLQPKLSVAHGKEFPHNLIKDIPRGIVRDRLQAGQLEVALADAASLVIGRRLAQVGLNPNLIFHHN